MGRFDYNTGVSSQPIDIAGAGQRLMQSAVEQKLADIEQGRAMADESQKSALEAMSMKTIQGLDRNLQEKYTKKFEEHRQDIINQMSKGGGVLSRPQQMAIRNKQQDIINDTMADNEAMQARNEVRKFMLDPNTQYGYNIDNIAKELREWDSAFERGEYLGDPRTMLLKHQIEAPVSGYIDKRYKAAIDKLDIESLAGLKGNVFKETRLSGLDVTQQESLRKVRDFVSQAMEDPNIKSRYTANDGAVFEEKRAEIQQQIEDAISQRISETKPYRTSSYGSGRSSYDPYVVEDATEEIIPVGDGNMVAQAERTVPFSNVSSFSFGGEKFAVESVQYYETAANPKHYKEWVQNRYDKGLEGEEKLYKPDEQSIHQYGVVAKEHLDDYNGETALKPFAKLGKSKSKNPYEYYGDIDPKDLEISYKPFEGTLKGAILVKTLSKKDDYVRKFDELDAKGRVTKKKEIPTVSMSELKALGYSDKQIKEFVESGKVKIK